MGYDFYLDRTRLPVAPSKLQVKINGGNKTLTLINGGEINILKKAGLTDISFAALLPNVKHPFASYDGGFKDASFYLGELKRLKTQTDGEGRFMPFHFKVSRALPDGRVLFDTNFEVSLEDYKITDDIKDGFDVTVEISLKQYESYGTKVVEIRPPNAAQPQTTATIEQKRAAVNPPSRQPHTVVKGDCLWAIARKYLGDGNRYPEIYELNKAEIDARNKGTGNVKYTIYPGQVFALPQR